MSWLHLQHVGEAISWSFLPLPAGESANVDARSMKFAAVAPLAKKGTTIDRRQCADDRHLLSALSGMPQQDEVDLSSHHQPLRPQDLHEIV